MKRLSLFFTLIFSILTIGCGELDPHVLSTLDQITQQPQSPYTGRLIPVSNVKQFGIGAEDAVALEWGNGKLYMLADHGTGANHAQYLFTVDHNTGIAEFVNSSAMDLGGSSNFTQVRHTEPTDMSWVPLPNNHIGYPGYMIGICPIIDSIIVIDIETGHAKRINREKGYHILNTTRDTALNQHIIHATAITHFTQKKFFMTGRTNKVHNNALFQIHEDFLYANTITENPPINFNINETVPYTLCYDDTNLYMTGADTQSFYIINQYTGEATFISNWYSTNTPKKNQNFQITGLTYNGHSMYAVCYSTDTLYKLAID